jgi:hypothetical protein
MVYSIYFKVFYSCYLNKNSKGDYKIKLQINDCFGSFMLVQITK